MVFRSPPALYGWHMADDRDTLFASQLAGMSDDEVRRQFDPSIQPVPILRTIAVTELEKRRQRRANALTEKNLSAGQVAAWISALAAIVGAVVLWFRYFSTLIEP